jgi:hypothetical protein
MGEERASCTLCVNFSIVEGQPGCQERPKVHEREDFPFKDADCKYYRYVFDFSKLYNKPRIYRPKD